MAFGTAEFRRKKCLDPFPSERVPQHAGHLIDDNTFPYAAAAARHTPILVHVVTYTAWTGPSPSG
jgi:hypothetical protein